MLHLFLASGPRPEKRRSRHVPSRTTMPGNPRWRGRQVPEHNESTNVQIGFGKKGKRSLGIKMRIVEALYVFKKELPVLQNPAFLLLACLILLPSIYIKIIYQIIKKYKIEAKTRNETWDA